MAWQACSNLHRNQGDPNVSRHALSSFTFHIFYEFYILNIWVLIDAHVVPLKLSPFICSLNHASGFFGKFMGTCQYLIACLYNLPDTLKIDVFLNSQMTTEKNEYKNGSYLYGINSGGRLLTLYSVRLHAEEKMLLCNCRMVNIFAELLFTFYNPRVFPVRTFCCS